MQIRLYTLPNLVTLCGLLSGAAAVVAAMAWGDLTLAFWLLAAAVVFDFLDGFTARLTGCASPVGVQLDSLADMVSSGFLPAAVLYVLWQDAGSVWSWSAVSPRTAGLCVFVVAAFSALRLARFNVDTTQTSEFRGLPTPACSLFFVSAGMLVRQEGIDVPREALLAAALLFSWLLVSPIRMFALKFHGFGWRGNGLRYLFIAACAVLLIALQVRAVPLIIVLYIVVSTVRWLSCPACRAAQRC